MKSSVHNGRKGILTLIRKSYDLFSLFGGNTPPELLPLMEETKRAIERSRHVMQSSGVYHICRRCDLEEGGSCCGKGIEERYTLSLILANVFEGHKLPEKPYRAEGCLFLGPQGCLLTFRHTLCVNFLCGNIYRELGLEAVKNLQDVCGKEMDLTFQLCEAITKLLNKLSNKWQWIL